MIAACWGGESPARVCARSRRAAVSASCYTCGVNPSIDVFTLAVAVAILLLVFLAAARTRSSGMRFTLLTFAAIVIGLMLWNLATHGGLHAV